MGRCLTGGTLLQLWTRRSQAAKFFPASMSLQRPLLTKLNIVPLGKGKIFKGLRFVFTGEVKWRIWSWELIKSYTCFSLTLHRGWSLERTAGATNLRSAQHGAHISSPLLLTPWTTSWIGLPPWVGSNSSQQKASFFSPDIALVFSGSSMCSLQRREGEMMYSSRWFFSYSLL